MRRNQTKPFKILKKKLPPNYVPTYYGLYYKNDEETSIPLPLRNIDVKVRIIESVAKVEYSQVFENNSDKTLQVFYIFPISTDSCFDGFSAKYKSTTIEGEIHKKEHAKKKFKESVKEGKTAIYASISEQSNDLMQVKIGNMEPSTSITINLSFIEQLDTSANKLWKYTILGGLKPRYKSKRTDMEIEKKEPDTISILNYPYLPSDDPQAYKWKIVVEIESSSTINFIECPSYKIQTEYDQMVKAVIKLDPSEDFTPTKDFTIYYSTEELNKPRALLTQYDDGYCAMINYVPQTNHKNLSDAYKIELESQGVNIPDIEFEKTKSEFIFLIDRSGSMSGHLIKMAREALVIFLKSIPNDAHFNIVSFGGDYNMYSQKGSLLASQENVQAAVNDVLTYEGDMGGTEILTPLEAIYRLNPIPGTKKKIYLLTDGEVYNMKAIFKSIENHADEARVFSVGIGKSASRELIIQSAKYGKGCHEFVEDANKIGEKVISLLTLSMQICAHSFQLTYPLGLQPNMAIPHPNFVGPVYEGKYLTFFVFFGKELGKRESILLNLVYKRDEKLEGSNQGIEIKVKECLTDTHPLNQAIYKLGFHKLFSLFENEADQKTSDLVYFGHEVVTRHEVEPLSIRYGVLSKKTAFICVMKDENNNIVNTKQAKVVVPHLIAPDNPVDDATLASRGGSGGYRGGRGGSLAKGGGRGGFKARSRAKAKKTSGIELEGEEELGSLSRSRSRSRSKSSENNSPFVSFKNDRSLKFKKKENFLYNFREEQEKSSESLLSLLERNTFQPQMNFRGLQEESLQLNTLPLQKHKQVDHTQNYNKVFSIINQQDSSGKWQYSEVLLNILGVDVDKFKNSIPENVKQNPEALTLSMTALVLVCLREKYSEQKSVWMLVYRKGNDFLKSKGVDLPEFKDLQHIL